MSGYKVCPSCGRQNPADAQWCASCGNNISNVAPPQNWQQPQQNYQGPPPQYQQPPVYGQPQYQQPQQYGPPMPPPMPVKMKSEGLAAVLSFLIPGLGQIYNGEIGRGIGILVLAIILGILFFLLVTMLILLILWIWNIYDAYITAREMNRIAMSQAGYYQYPR